MNPGKSSTEPVLEPDGPEEDVRLAARCADGEREAQQTLFRAYRARVHATLYRIMGSNRDMEDLVQEVFLQVFRSLHNYRGDARLATWMSRITTRVAYAHLTRREPKAVALEAVPDPVASTPGAERQAAAREALRRLYAILDCVDAKQRVAFALHVIDGRPIREVAEMTGTSVTATKTRIWRARKDIARRAGKDPLLAGFIHHKEKGR